MIANGAPVGYTGGDEQFAKDVTMIRANWTGYLAKYDVPPKESTLGQIGDLHFHLGLYDLWEGRSDLALSHFCVASEAIPHYIESFEDRWELVSRMALEAGTAIQGALACEFVGQSTTAQSLFEKAGLLGSGRISPDQAPPPTPTDTHDDGAVGPLYMAYGLIRSGRLDGFEACVYTVPWPDAHKTKPAWVQTNIETLILTAEVIMARTKANRGRTIMRTQRGLPPLLRALMSCLRSPHDASLIPAAQKALMAYYKLIQDTSDFMDIYPLILDLQEAYPQIFKPVVPNPLHVG